MEREVKTSAKEKDEKVWKLRKCKTEHQNYELGAAFNLCHKTSCIQCIDQMLNRMPAKQDVIGLFQF